MTAILVLLFFVAFLVADHFVKAEPSPVCAQKPLNVVEQEDAETDEVMAKMRRTNSASAKD